MPGYFQVLLIFAYALPVPSAGPLFTDAPQAAGIAFANLSLGPATAAGIEVTWLGGKRQIFCAVLADHRYAIHWGVNRLMPE